MDKRPKNHNRKTWNSYLRLRDLDTTIIYPISNEGVIDVGRPGNSPGAWLHDILDHSVIPYPDSGIDEFVALGASLVSGSYRNYTVNPSVYISGVVNLVRGYKDSLCEVNSGMSGYIQKPSSLSYIPEPTWENISSWIKVGGEIFKERFPNSYWEIFYRLKRPMSSASMYWGKSYKFERLMVDFKSFNVFGMRGGYVTWFGR